MQIKVSYITANEIMESLGIGRSKAFRRGQRQWKFTEAGNFS